MDSPETGSGETTLAASAEAAAGAAGEQEGVKGWLGSGEEPGATIGRYKLLEKVGEGGFGAVYVAEQKEPVRRRVALKILKLGMDTRQVVARFEAERQALALMDHPNIAKVLDGGATEKGRPYFVMELVRGIWITQYCDQNKVPPRKRLELFVQVCHAIQHAHQKGVIHRDVKPSNILVTLHDGAPVPKVIDFGIAKATQQELTDKTVYTQLQQFIGTPAYMSPEQAEMSGLDIDTRSDIYSLGVLLYELLTGRTPFEGRESMGVEAMRKAIREEEPARPSTRVAGLAGEERSSTAARRSLEAPRLVHVLRGDLDWIVMKCLEKDRTRRYETANGLAVDIVRHLSDEAVSARPPSAGYRFQRAVRRHRVAFGAGVAVSGALVLGMVGSTWQAVRARRAEALAVQSRAESEKLSNFMLDDFYEELEPAGRFETVARMARQVVAYYDGLPATLRTKETERNRVMAEARLALFTARQGEIEAASGRAREAVAALEKLRGEGDLSEPTLYALGLAKEAEFLCVRTSGAEVRELIQRGSEALRGAATSAEGSRRVKLEYANLMNYQSHNEAPAEGMKSCERALRVLEGLGALELRDLSAASAWADVADSEAREAMEIGRLEEAEALEKQVEKVAQGVLAQRPGDLRARVDLSFSPGLLSEIAARRGRIEEALALQNQAQGALAEYLRFNPADSAARDRLAIGEIDMADLLAREGRLSAALERARSGLESLRARGGNRGGPPVELMSWSAIARWESQRGNRGASEEALRQATLLLEGKEGVAVEFLASSERTVKLAFGEEVEVYGLAMEALPRLDALDGASRSEDMRPLLEFVRRETLEAAARSALRLKHYEEAEKAARQLLRLATEEGGGAVPSGSKEWAEVLLGEAALGRGDAAGARALLGEAVGVYRESLSRGGTDVTDRIRFARALYGQALAQGGEGTGAATRKAALAEAAEVLGKLPQEARECTHARELLGWMASEKDRD